VVTHRDLFAGRFGMKIEKNVDKPKQQKKSKTPSNGDNWDNVKDFLGISPFL
jgi:hypothetical protein